MPYQPVTVKPNTGGQLVTRMAFDNVGADNYVVKRDWRRVMDAEVRREGDTLFYPDTDVAIGQQATPPVGGSPITLIHHARKPNGKTALIIGTATQLYRFYIYEDGEVYAGDTGGSGVYDTGVYEDVSGAWLKIGDNFHGGHRWEAIEVSGKTVFNNGVDLPMVYDVEWAYVQPLYELREQGIASVGTIWEFNGCLFGGDITEIPSADLPDVMNGRGGGVIDITMTAGAVTSDTNFFVSSDVGKTLIFKLSGEAALITGYIDAKHILVNLNHNAASQNAFIVATLYGVYTGTTNRIQYRLLWSNFGNAQDFASDIPVTINEAGDTTITLQYPAFSFTVGDEVLVDGAGDSGSSLDTFITNIDYTRTQITIADSVVNGPDVDNPITFSLSKASALSSISGAQDLQDDGSAILRGTQLQGRMIVLKDTGIFLGAATGDVTKPFTFSVAYRGPNTIFWQWMLESVNEQFILFAGKNEFYAFDLSMQIPNEHSKLRLCSDLFFQNVTSQALSDQCFSSQNEVTGEIWFVFPNTGSDKAICYDIKYDTCSTIGAAYSATAPIKPPVAGVSVGAEKDWFVMGTATGTILLYGLTDTTTGLWTRNTANYDSILKSGYVDFGDGYNEKDLRSHVLYFSNVSPAPIELTMFGARNANEPPQTLFTRTIAAPTYKNLTPTYYRKLYFQDQLRVTGSSANAEISARTFDPGVIQSNSATRHP